MSSYVISNCNYVKAMGFIAGLADNKNHYGDPVLRLWNNDTRRLFTDADFKASAEWLYTLNALSVQKQYNDKTAETDPADYTATFEAAKKASNALYKNIKKSAEDVKKLRVACFGFLRFADSALYQIDDENYFNAAESFFNRVNTELFKLVKSLDGIKEDDLSDFWGSFNPIF